MGMLDKNAGDMQNPKASVPHSEIILNELRTLSIHSKLNCVHVSVYFPKIAAPK